MKKIASMVLVLILALALTVPALAATVVNQTDHSYKAYQVFSGTQETDGGPLGDIEWGSGVDGTKLLTELNKINAFANCKSAADVAKVLDGRSDNCDEAVALADTATKCLGTTYTQIPAKADSIELDTGYWLLVDDSTPEPGDARNAALLQVANKGNIVIEKKYDAPEVDKTVNDNDANIGDEVTFTLTATMPSILDGYDTYKVIFHDTMSPGLTFTGNVTVEINGEDVTSGFTVSTATVSDTEGNYVNGTEITISCDNVLALGAKESSKIVVTYTAELNQSAVIGTNGNPNKVILEYSNDPNWDGTGTEPTGDTPQVEVKVFTWKIPVSKVDGDGTKLAGAQFSLFKDEACTDNMVISVVAKGNNIYNVCTKNDSSDEHKHISVITTDSAGEFEIHGLEKGTYYLKEIKAPAGYNLLTDPIKVTIGDNGVITIYKDDEDTISSETATVVTVVNLKGSTLPETGGIGTTIFYVVGGVLVVGALIVLITKKRMAAK